MAVRCDFHAMLRGRVKDEVVVVVAQALEAALDHVVAVEVLDEGHDAGLEAGDDHADLVGPGDGLDELLDGAGAVG